MGLHTRLSTGAVSITSPPEVHISNKRLGHWKLCHGSGSHTVPMPWPLHLLFYSIPSCDPNHPHSCFLCLFHFPALSPISPGPELLPASTDISSPPSHPSWKSRVPHFRHWWKFSLNYCSKSVGVSDGGQDIPKATDCHCSLQQWGASFSKKIGHWSAEYELCSSQRFQELPWSVADALSPGKLSEPWSDLRQGKSGARSAGNALLACLTLEKWIDSQPWGLCSFCWLCSHITKDSHGRVTPQTSLKTRAEAVTAEETVLDSFSGSSWHLS